MGAVAVLKRLGSGFAALGSGDFIPVANGGTGDTGTAWTTYTPTLSASTGTLTSASATGRYKQLGKTVHVQIVVTITTNGSAAVYVVATLPALGSPAAEYVLAGRNAGTDGKLLQGYISSAAAQVLILAYDNTYPGANGARLVLSGFYEVL